MDAIILIHVKNQSDHCLNTNIEHTISIEHSFYSPGTYEHGIGRDRKVNWHQSFGGEPINLPSVKQHSTIDKNTEKVSLQL